MGVMQLNCLQLVYASIIYNTNKYAIVKVIYLAVIKFSIQFNIYFETKTSDGVQRAVPQYMTHPWLITKFMARTNSERDILVKLNGDAYFIYKLIKTC